MELKVDDGLNADPQTADIVQAVDAKPQGANWHIRLQSDGGDHIEAFAGEDGLYRLAFVDRGRRFDAAGPVDAETLKTVLVYYLNGDSDWRRQCQW